MAIYKKIEGDELYLYMNGNLIYKRWLNTGQSKVFDVMAYDKYTLSSIKDMAVGSDSEKYMYVKARIKLIATEEGGRLSGIKSGYKPNHVFEQDEKGMFKSTFMGEVDIDDQKMLEPGEEKDVTVKFLLDLPIEEFLNIGRRWWLYDGSKLVGEGQITGIVILK